MFCFTVTNRLQSLLYILNWFSCRITGGCSGVEQTGACQSSAALFQLYWACAPARAFYLCGQSFGSTSEPVENSWRLLCGGAVYVNGWAMVSSIWHTVLTISKHWGIPAAHRTRKGPVLQNNTGTRDKWFWCLEGIGAGYNTTTIETCKSWPVRLPMSLCCGVTCVMLLLALDFGW